ncbi:hypothetical protein MKW94_012336 [Papaver nudicaule]|uniref:Serine-rich protein n=1 Tax=Papaver nudicaule TaxID=74823 RepID=A0AA41V0C3_PAPNU|nr:hypothetical protein [Papaver nudicaule]
MSKGMQVRVPSSPKESDGGAGSNGGQSVASNSPRVSQCLCSPTTHTGSFRCRYHRSLSSTWRMKRSNSMPANSAATTSISSKAVEST